MNSDIVKQIGIELNLDEKKIINVLSLLEEGNTIPFIARYRKEATGNMDEDNIKRINEYYEYQVNLLKRKEDVIRLIDEKGLMTDELKEKILGASKLVEVEDLYRPYKEKKKTKATDAINNGLEPLAKQIMSFPLNGSFDELAKKYINDNVKTTLDAVSGAKYIIAEWISDNAYYRKWIRTYIYRNGNISSSIKKTANDEAKTYEMYYNYTEPLKTVKPHRVLALNRGEKEKILTVNIDIDEEKIINYLEEKIIKNDKSFVCDEVIDAIKDSYKRLIFPSIEREIRSELTDRASVSAIDNFSSNLKSLLMTPPMKGINVMGFDPAFRTGCKLAVLDKTGKVLDISVIYPHEPKCLYEERRISCEDTRTKK